MGKRKFFLTQDEITKLLKNYGGGYRFKKNTSLSEPKQIAYNDTSNGGMLTLNERWDKEKDETYIMVHLSHSDGKIYRKDKWNYFSDIHQLYFDYSIDDKGEYDLDFKELDGGKMATKRLTKCQKLEQELERYKKWLEDSEERNRKLREQAENSFLNSPTYHQMAERISFVESLNKLNESHIKSLERSKQRVDNAVQQVYADNKAMLEHYKPDYVEDGENPYFIGITENYHDSKEYEKLRTKVSDLEGTIKGYDTIVADRDSEIERLQGIIGELRHQLSQNQTTTLSDDMQREYEQALQNATSFNNLYVEATNENKKLLERISELSSEIEEMKLQNESEPTTEDITDDELETLSTYQIKEKFNSKYTDKSWTSSYETMTRSELVKRLHYTESVSNRRSEQIKELKKEIRDKKYNQYVQEDAITYNVALQKISSLEHNIELLHNLLEQSNNRIDELQKQNTELATTTLSSDEAVGIIEQNIEQTKQLKSETRRKQGRPPKMDERTIALIHGLKNNGHSIRDIASQVGYSVGSIHRVLKKDGE